MIRHVLSLSSVATSLSVMRLGDMYVLECTENGQTWPHQFVSNQIEGDALSVAIARRSTVAFDAERGENTALTDVTCDVDDDVLPVDSWYMHVPMGREETTKPETLRQDLKEVGRRPPPLY